MSDVLETLRHPDIDDTIRIWASISEQVDLSDASDIASVPGVPTRKLLEPYGGVREMQLNRLYRPLVLGSAIRALAKALEMNENAERCRGIGATASSLMLSYDAAYLAGRSLAMLLGFCQVSRDSEVMVDVFAVEGAARRGLQEEVAAFVVFGRWQHENLWNLLHRLIRTTKKNSRVDYALKHFRSDKFKSFSAVRNRQIYSDLHLYGGDLEDEANFPIDCDVGESAAQVCRRYRQAFEHLMIIIFDILDGAELRYLLETHAHHSRFGAWAIAA